MNLDTCISYVMHVIICESRPVCLRYMCTCFKLHVINAHSAIHIKEIADEWIKDIIQ